MPWSAATTYGDAGGVTVAKRYPAIDGLFTWPSDDPRLIAARCEDCSTVTFPRSAELHRPNCRGERVSTIELSGTGTLVSYTIQRFPPPYPYISDPDAFEPYGIGTVELPDGIQVPGQITGIDIEDIEVGLEVDVVIETLYVDEDGNEALTWKWAPALERSEP